MKLNWVLMLKMVLGFIIGMFIAMILKLPYFYTAGVIAVLSFEETKKASLNASIKRIFSTILALSLSGLLFYLFSFDVWVLFLFVGLFIVITFIFQIDKGIIVSLVLVSQIYLEKDIYYAINAFYILLIGLGVAFLLNLYIPKNKLLNEKINAIDSKINLLIQDIANTKPVYFNEVDMLLKETYENIQIEIDNTKISKTTSILKYVEMRTEQVNILKRVNNSLSNVDLIEEKQKILNFLKTFNNKIGTYNFAESLSLELNDLLTYFRKTKLPENRILFEKRAQLYYVLLELDQFLNLKLLYHKLTLEKSLFP